MTSGKELKIGTHTFSGKAEALRYVQRLRDEWIGRGPIDKGNLNGEASRFIYSLLLRHQRSAEKIGEGVDYFEVRRGPKSQHGGVNYCFWIIRTDGTSIDFSYGHCITTEAVIPEEPGVYVYTYPHYLRYPYTPENGRKLFKVGMSSNAAYRVSEQQRTTNMPERAVAVRFYATDNAQEAEAYFHKILKNNGQHHEAPGAGSEWFNTSLRNLDSIATRLQLPILDLIEARQQESLDNPSITS